jgi:hypothetical protein
MLQAPEARPEVSPLRNRKPRWRGAAVERWVDDLRIPSAGGAVHSEQLTVTLHNGSIIACVARERHRQR